MGDAGEWSAQVEDRADAMQPWPAQALQAALELPGAELQTGDALPPFWRWLYFLEARPPSELGRDGHPAQGVGLIPETGLPRRMWAGGRIEYRRPLILGRPAHLRSTVASVARKTGRSGPLCFVTLRHEASDADGVAEIEEQDLVYREDPTAEGARPSAAPPPAAKTETRTADWSQDWTADATLLFRYSALTFNGHRIHYDLDYARTVEGYAGLVVHGPLLATLMLELVRANASERRVARFAFRARAPVIAGDQFRTVGVSTDAGAELWVEDMSGATAMTGEVIYA